MGRRHPVRVVMPVPFQRRARQRVKAVQRVVDKFPPHGLSQFDVELVPRLGHVAVRLAPGVLGTESLPPQLRRKERFGKPVGQPVCLLWRLPRMQVRLVVVRQQYDVKHRVPVQLPRMVTPSDVA